MGAKNRGWHTIAPMSSEAESATGVFRPDRAHLIGAGVMGLMSLLAVGMAPIFLFWIPLLPAVFAYWVLTARTFITEDGIEARYAFSRPKKMTWDNFNGILFGSSRAFACGTDDNKFPLPGVTFNSLPELTEASQGRIPDALTAGHHAADEKVVVIHQDGRQMLTDKSDVADDTDEAS